MKYDVNTHSNTPLSHYRHTFDCWYCMDRKVDVVYDKDLRKNISTACPKCDSRRDRTEDDRMHGKDFQIACTWFRKTSAPTKPFNLYPWKTINDPAALWKRIYCDLRSDNFYVKERLIDEMISLYGVFNPVAASDGEDF